MARNRLALVLLLLLLATAGLSAAPALAGEDDAPPAAQRSAKEPAVRWLESYAEGIEQANKRGKPLLLFFHAQWCSWCKVMERETYADERVAALCRKFVCVKVDVDRDKRAAFTYRVQAIPRTIMLSTRGEIIGDHQGNILPDMFRIFLEEAIRDKDRGSGRLSAIADKEAERRVDQIARRLAADAATVDLGELADLLGHKDPAVRRRAGALLVKCGDRARPALVAALDGVYLGARLAAARALREVKGAPQALDAWASRVERRRAARPWKKWSSPVLEREFDRARLREQAASLARKYAAGRFRRAADRAAAAASGAREAVYRAGGKIVVIETDYDRDGTHDEAILQYAWARDRLLVARLERKKDAFRLADWWLELGALPTGRVQQ